jgi:hypothetical protein
LYPGLRILAHSEVQLDRRNAYQSLELQFQLPSWEHQRLVPTLLAQMFLNLSSLERDLHPIHHPNLGLVNLQLQRMRE